MEIVATFACSHAALMISRADKAPADLREHVYGAFRRMGQEISELAPDAIVLIGTDHHGVYPLSSIPQFCIGVSEVARGIGDGGLPKTDLPIHQSYARELLSGMLAAGVDMSFSEDMAIDHSFVVPLLLALGTCRFPIVPIAQNCNTPPLPTLRRSHEVGTKLGEVFRRGPEGRVVLIGTGGLSHWVGSVEYRAFMNSPAGSRIATQKDHPRVHPESRPVNEAFDRGFLAQLSAGNMKKFIDEWTGERIEAEAGNGAQEIRNWLLLAGSVGDRPATVLGYAPVEQWLTGSAVVRFDMSAKDMSCVV